MPEAIDAKAELLAYLSGKATVPVFPKRPDGKLPSTFIVVIDVGGAGRYNRICASHGLIVDIYAPTDGLANAEALVIDALIHSLPQSDVPFTSVEAGLPRENPDPQTPDHARRSTTYILTSLLKG